MTKFNYQILLKYIFFSSKSLVLYSMSRRILHYQFPKGVDSIFLDGKRYTRAEFEKAKEREKRRDKKGRFVSAQY